MSYQENLSFQYILQNRLYYHHFQPIVGIHNLKITGYESLLRSKYIDHPESIFHTAIKLNSLFELDISSAAMAIHSFGNQLDGITADTLLYVNFYPSTLVTPGFQKTLMNIMEEADISADQLVIEMNEAEQIQDYAVLKQAILHLKAIGIQIALDDFDKGTAPFRKILELKPNYIKFDKYISDHLLQSLSTQELLKSILHYCSSHHIQTVLEGIETDKELHVARSLGVDLGQGYLFGKPELLNKHI